MNRYSEHPEYRNECVLTEFSSQREHQIQSDLGFHLVECRMLRSLAEMLEAQKKFPPLSNARNPSTVTASG